MLVLSSILLSAAGQLFMKIGMQALAGAGALPPSVGSALQTPAVLWTGLGLLAYGASMLAWLGVLTRFALSYAYPLLSISYILVYVGAIYWPGIQEEPTPARTIGTLLIALGVGLVSSTARHGSSSASSTPR